MRAALIALALAGCTEPPLTASMGPIALAAGQETTLCATFQLDNPDPLLITRITADLASGSHHLIVYRSSATEATPAPVPCSPFSNIIGGAEVPLFIIERAHDELVWPAGVGVRIGARQMVRLEAHYLNPEPHPIEGRGTVTLEGVPPSSDLQESDFAFWGTTNIYVPAQSTAATPTRFQAGIAGTHGFALTTHQHRMGTRFQVLFDNRQLANTTDWADPPLYRLDPTVDFDGANGLNYQCEWQNTTDTPIGYGESALQEMCFLWMYYYPARGTDVCIDGNCFGRSPN